MHVNCSVTGCLVSQGYEDWLRHKADNEVNGALVFVVRSGSLVKTQSKNIRVRCPSERKITFSYKVLPGDIVQRKANRRD